MTAPIGPPDPAVEREGVSAVTREDIRWERCDIKAITLLANVLMRQEAADERALEAILIRDGMAVEGAASNLFVVEEEVLTTPPKGPYLLPGVTRDLVLELAADAGLAVAERPVPRERLAAAEEIWLTSSTREIMPVTRLDGRAVGPGRPGHLWHRMQGLYQDYKRSLRRAGP
jgi:D-alanine transaminase